MPKPLAEWRNHSSSYLQVKEYCEEIPLFFPSNYKLHCVIGTVQRHTLSLSGGVATFKQHESRRYGNLQMATVC